MRILAFAFAAAVFAVPSFASDEADVLAVVKHYNDALNKGDDKAALADCAGPGTIIDNLAPHTWTGASACADWLASYEAFSKKNGLTDGVVTTGKPWQFKIDGDVAYVVLPADFTYKKGGKPGKKAGAVWTLVLHKAAGRWKINSWAWSGH